MVNVTSDKCYENQEWVYAYREIDPMGGYDPYSASKAAAEILVASYRRSFFPPEDVQSHGVKVATVRAGNVMAPDPMLPFQRLQPPARRLPKPARRVEQRPLPIALSEHPRTISHTRSLRDPPRELFRQFLLRNQDLQDGFCRGTLEDP